MFFSLSFPLSLVWLVCQIVCKQLTVDIIYETCPRNQDECVRRGGVFTDLRAGRERLSSFRYLYKKRAITMDEWDRTLTIKTRSEIATKRWILSWDANVWKEKMWEKGWGRFLKVFDNREKASKRDPWSVVNVQSSFCCWWQDCGPSWATSLTFTCGTRDGVITWRVAVVVFFS